MISALRADGNITASQSGPHVVMQTSSRGASLKTREAHLDVLAQRRCDILAASTDHDQFFRHISNGEGFHRYAESLCVSKLHSSDVVERKKE
jgi:hypothetical protein